jgi:serine/threonine protein kinase
MAPEQARGRTIGSAADIFALGLLLYELASGRHPFASAAGPLGAVGADDVGNADSAVAAERRCSAGPRRPDSSDAQSSSRRCARLRPTWIAPLSTLTGAPLAMVRSRAASHVVGREDIQAELGARVRRRRHRHRHGRRDWWRAGPR